MAELDEPTLTATAKREISLEEAADKRGSNEEIMGGGGKGGQFAPTEREEGQGE